MPTRRRAALPAPPRTDAQTPRFRSGAVARMLRMPVATLRIWERRYGVSAPATTPSGHRLYSSADVQRLALLRQLTDVGHAIGSIASLDMERLRQVAATHAGTLASARQAPAPAAPARVVVVGAALARRLRHPSLRQWLGTGLEVVKEVAALDRPVPASLRGQIDLLLVAAPSLHEDLLEPLQAAARAWGARTTAVLYGFGTGKATEAAAAAGFELAREPQDDHALASWLLKALRANPAAVAARAQTDAVRARPADPPWTLLGELAPRRYDDATLADFAGLSTTIACECPRHVADLLVQLSHFEAYSGECESRSAKDAALHAYLAQVAGASRTLFEVALERIAIEEGLVLPR
jgi:DNA-binding transcriptional MerR regulator